jgi:hypothetical protein
MLFQYFQYKRYLNHQLLKLQRQNILVMGIFQNPRKAYVQGNEQDLTIPLVHPMIQLLRLVQQMTFKPTYHV